MVTDWTSAGFLCLLQMVCAEPIYAVCQVLRKINHDCCKMALSLDSVILLPQFQLCAVMIQAACCLQLQVAKDIIAKDGAGGLYKGLSAGLLRQATYTTARLGIFQIFSDLLKQQNQGKVNHKLHVHVCKPDRSGVLSCVCVCVCVPVR